MSQSLILLAYQTLGTLIAFAFVPKRGWLCAALGVPVGLAATALLVLPLSLLGVASSSSIVLGWIGMVIVAAGVVSARRKPTRQESVQVALWMLGFIPFAVTFSAMNLSTFTYDSHIFLMLTRAIQNGNGLDTGSLQQLSSWGSLLTLAHVPAQLVGAEYLHSLALTMGLSLVATFGILLHGELKRSSSHLARPSLFVAIMCVGLVSTGFVFHHLVYIHTNLLAAVYLFFFVSLFREAEVGGDSSLLPVAFLSLCAFSLSRVEAPVIALVFLVLTTVPSNLPRRSIARPYLFYTLIVGGWYLVLSQNVKPTAKFLTPSKCYFVIAVVVAGYAHYLLSHRKLVAKLNRFIPAASLLLASAALVGAFVSKPGHMWESLSAFTHNHFYSPLYWGAFWYFIILAALLTIGRDKVKSGRALAIGTVLYVLLVLVLAYGRTPYRIAPRDSAARMMLHIAPLTFFYLSMRIVPIMGVANKTLRAGAVALVAALLVANGAAIARHLTDNSPTPFPEWRPSVQNESLTELLRTSPKKALRCSIAMPYWLSKAVKNAEVFLPKELSRFKWALEHVGPVRVRFGKRLPTLPGERLGQIDGIDRACVRYGKRSYWVILAQRPNEDRYVLVQTDMRKTFVLLGERQHQELAGVHESKPGKPE